MESLEEAGEMPEMGEEEIASTNQQGFVPVQRKINELKMELDKYLKLHPEQSAAAKGRIKRMLGLE